jgi:Tfp pilus assembly protein PilN
MDPLELIVKAVTAQAIAYQSQALNDIADLLPGHGPTQVPDITKTELWVTYLQQRADGKVDIKTIDSIFKVLAYILKLAGVVLV